MADRLGLNSAWPCRQLEGRAQIMSRTAKRLSAMRTEEYFDERARRADPVKVRRILARVGKGNPAMEGDELAQNSTETRKRKMSKN